MLTRFTLLLFEMISYLKSARQFSAAMVATPHLNSRGHYTHLSLSLGFIWFFTFSLLFLSNNTFLKKKHICLWIQEFKKRPTGATLNRLLLNTCSSHVVQSQIFCPKKKKSIIKLKGSALYPTQTGDNVQIPAHSFSSSWLSSLLASSSLLLCSVCPFLLLASSLPSHLLLECLKNKWEDVSRVLQNSYWQ